MSSWGGVMDDCLKSIELYPQNMKAFYYLAQAQAALNRPNEALTSALKAYDFCVKTNSPSMSFVSALVLKIKKELWDHREKRRIREQSELLSELTDRLERARDVQTAAVKGGLERGEKSSTEAEEEIRIIKEISQRKMDDLHRIFALAHPSNLKKRVSRSSCHYARR
jgi:STIP1 family protein 1